MEGNLGSALDASDRLAEAEPSYRRALELAPQREGTRVCLALNLLARSRGYQTEYAYQVAEVYGARGDADLAIDWLERAYAQRDGGLSELKISRLLRSLYAYARRDAVLRKMGLAD